MVSIKGNPDHVLSRGHICPKATAIADLQDDPDRLRSPMKRTGRRVAGNGLGSPPMPKLPRALLTELQADKARLAFLCRQSQPPMIMHIAGQMGALRKRGGIAGHFFRLDARSNPAPLCAISDVWPCQPGRCARHRSHAKAIVIVGGTPAASNGSIWTVPDFKEPE